VLGGQRLDEGQRGLQALGEDRLGGVEGIEDRLVVADGDGQRALAMLGLRLQVERQRLDVRAVGRDHGQVGRAGEAVDPDHAGHLPLGLLDPEAAWADDHVDLRNGLGAVRERRDRLRTGDREHAVDLAEPRRGEDHRVRRRGDVDLVDARRTRRDRAHDDGGRVGVATARRVDHRASHGDLA
jgi:hypothetical protein